MQELGRAPLPHETIFSYVGRELEPDRSRPGESATDEEMPARPRILHHLSVNKLRPTAFIPAFVRHSIVRGMPRPSSPTEPVDQVDGILQVLAYRTTFACLRRQIVLTQEADPWKSK